MDQSDRLEQMAPQERGENVALPDSRVIEAQRFEKLLVHVMTAV